MKEDKKYLGDLSKRQKLNLLNAQLDNERSTFLSHWNDCATFIFPTRPRFTVSDVNKGDRRNQKIIDSSPTFAARTLRAGMMGGVTSPARPWFRLTTPDPDMAEIGPVKQWLYLVDKRMNTVFLRSNLYNMLPTTYGDMGTFGTSALHIDEDFESVIHTYCYPIGSYKIACDSKGRVNTFSRDFQMTVRNVISKFCRSENGDIDFSNVSDYIKTAWLNGQTEQRVDICHVIKPNDRFDPTKIESKFKKFESTYYEAGTSNMSNVNYLTMPDNEKFLSEKGYDYFPVLCPRWEVTGEDVYATNWPAAEALGDIKQLMLGERRTMQAVEKMINPPLVGPTSLRNQKTSLLPGDITWSDTREGQQGLRPVHEVRFDINQMEQKQAQVRQRISRAFYEDLFLMLAQSDRREITAREIDERHEEKLLALGPVLEQLNQDLLNPLIDITFDIMNRQGLIPEAPQELQGTPLRVEFISIMAQAQKAIGIGSIERFAVFVNNTAAVSPTIFDKVDMDELIDVYGDLTSVPPSIVRPDEEVAAIRQERAKAQQMQQAAEMINQGSQAAKNLAQAPTNEQNALTDLLNQSNAGRIV